MNLNPHVVLIVETSSSYGRGILQGITRYFRPRSPWLIFFQERDLAPRRPAGSRNGAGDGVITRLMSQELADHFRRVRVPVVNVNDVHTAHGLPTVQSDHRMIGQLGAEHLLDRGFQQFAFCGFTGHEWSKKGAMDSRKGCALLAFLARFMNPPGRSRRCPPGKKNKKSSAAGCGR